MLIGAPPPLFILLKCEVRVQNGWWHFLHRLSPLASLSPTCYQRFESRNEGPRRFLARGLSNK